MSSSEPIRFAAWPVPEFRLLVAAGEEGPAGPSLEELAYERGLADGRRLGAEADERETLSARRALLGAAESLQAVRAAYASEMEEALFALATALAQHLVQRELAADPAIVRDLVRRALELVPLEGALEIKLHPADFAGMGSELDLYAPGGRRLDVRWTADPSVGRGGYLIETPHRVVDGQVDPVLQAMYERLRNA